MSEVSARLAAEQRARVLIDQQLLAAGWLVQDKRELNLFAGPGVAVREVVMKPGHGRADYLLYVDKLTVGVVEAKPEGTPLSGVEWQSAMYADGLPTAVRVEGNGSQIGRAAVWDGSSTTACTRTSRSVCARAANCSLPSWRRLELASEPSGAHGDLQLQQRIAYSERLQVEVVDRASSVNAQAGGAGRCHRRRTRCKSTVG